MKRIIAIAILAAAAAAAAHAHPHVFMDTRIEVACDGQGVSGFWITWKFGKAFTAGILMDFDADKNEQLSPAEVAVIEDKAFSNLANYNYFIYIRSSDRSHRPTRVRELTSYMEGGRVHYPFFVPYPLAPINSEEKINIAVYDGTPGSTFPRQVVLTLRRAS